MSVWKMSKRKKKTTNLFLLFDRKWNNWNPLRLITRAARQPKDDWLPSFIQVGALNEILGTSVLEMC